MPKRVPTPPPADDEPRYLTVVYPYAISGTCNMELPKDREDFARWVACCIDKNAFFAMFHKPSSRAMVILEVNRDYAHFDRILGEHRWSEFLQKPTKEEMGRVTQVFYCTYNTGRIVQKNGWKRIDVDEAWFKAWSAKNKHIKSPYPPTHFCDVPVEDRTNLSMCRPLPGAVKTPPPVVIAAPQPVVGSAAWIQSKEEGPSIATIIAQTKPNPLGAWGKGTPKPQAASARPNPTAGGSVKKTVGVSQASSTGVRIPAVGGGPIAVKSTNVWQNAGKKPLVTVPVTGNWEDSPPVSRQDTPVLRAASPPSTARRNAWESFPNHPPGLDLPSGTNTSMAQGTSNRAGSLSTGGWDSAGASTSSPDSDSGPDLTTATESDNPYAIHIHFSESMEEEFHGMRIREMEGDDGDLRELDSMAPLDNWDGPATMAGWETATAARWDDDALDAESLWKQNQEAPKPILCTAHGIICKKGICAEYAKQLRNKKRAEELEERKTAAANRGKKGGNGARAKGRGAGKKNDDKDGSEVNMTRNNNNNNPFRGPGAPVKTNWRGAPRAIVTADTMATREAPQAVSEGGWGNSDSEADAKATWVEPADAANAVDTASSTSWGMPENAFDPWAKTAPPAAKTTATRAGTGKPAGKKKPAQTNPSTSWADQVDAEFAAVAPPSKGADEFTAVSSKRGSKRGKSSATSRGTSAPKSSTSGWGPVADMP